MRTIFFSGSVCADNGMEETREETKKESEVEYETESEYDNDDVVEGESGDSWESESNASDSLYIPTPIRQNKTRPIDVPNKFFFFALPQLGNFFGNVE